MKRIALLLAILICFGCVFVSCGNDEDTSHSGSNSNSFSTVISDDENISSDYNDHSDHSSLNGNEDISSDSFIDDSSDISSDIPSDSSDFSEFESSGISSDESTSSSFSSTSIPESSENIGSGQDSSDSDIPHIPSGSLDISDITGGDIIIPTSQRINAIWISQFDLQPIFVSGGKQRNKFAYTEMAKKMISNLADSGFNTIFLQVRPNGDSMYESEYFPTSQYVAGSFGGRLDYDAIQIFIETAKQCGFEIHAWINPYRLCTPAQMEQGGKGKLLEWYNDSLGRRMKLGTDGKLYLDPSYPEATELICNGAREILSKYDFDGIHIDDYFYPTSFDIDDNLEFTNSGYTSKSDFRIANTNRTVKALYDTVHQFKGKVFGVSPAGNIHTLASKYYIDVYTWCKTEGYIDYILPQLYFGFDNSVCPFNSILKDWANAVKLEKIRLYIGLAAYKAEAASKGELDTYAGAIGKYEWQNNKDILKRQIEAIDKDEIADGFCIYTYSSLFDPVSGEANAYTKNEFENMLDYILK